MVPKRRPPSPHSCSKSRSPLRQLAAAKPSHVMKPNSSTKMPRATQFTFGTRLPSDLRGPIDHRGDRGAHDDPQQLEPVKERNAPPGRYNFVVEGWPEDDDDLDEEEQVPPAPTAASLVRAVHATSYPGRRV